MRHAAAGDGACLSAGNDVPNVAAVRDISELVVAGRADIGAARPATVRVGRPD